MTPDASDKTTPGSVERPPGAEGVAAPVTTVLHVAAVTHTGCLRDENQDCVLVGRWISTFDTTFAERRQLSAGESPYVAAVCDGMGGHAGGAIASRLAAATLGSRPWAGGGPTDTVAQIMAATSNIQLVSDRVQELRGLGTTVVGVAVQADSYTVFSVGDSSAFRSADGYLGILTEPDRREDPHRPGSTVLTQTLSAYTPTPRPHVEVFPIVRPIRLLLCSDGLTDPLDLERIRAELDGAIGEPGSADYAAAQLVQAAIDAGGPDNISVIVVDIVPSSDRPPPTAGR